MRVLLCASPLRPQFLLVRTPSSLPRRRRRAIVLSSIKGEKRRKPVSSSDGECRTRRVVLGSLSLGLALLFVGGTYQDAGALGWPPEGPLVEEFWDNVRRYGLYILTVSTGAIYTIFLPIAELLKNPITAVLVLALLLGGVFLVSQVVGAMVGISDFSYNYAY